MIVFHGTAAHHRRSLETRGLQVGAFVTAIEIEAEAYCPWATARSPVPGDDGLIVSADDVPAAWMVPDEFSSDAEAAFRLVRTIPAGRLAFRLMEVDARQSAHNWAEVFSPAAIFAGGERFGGFY